MSTQPEPSGEQAPGPPRRHPRYLSFLVTGALLGLAVTAVVVLLRGDQVERASVLFFYLGILLAAIGALLGGLVAVTVGSRRR